MKISFSFSLSPSMEVSFIYAVIVGTLVIYRYYKQYNIEFVAIKSDCYSEISSQGGIIADKV